MAFVKPVVLGTIVGAALVYLAKKSLDALEAVTDSAIDTVAKETAAHQPAPEVKE